MKPPKEPIVSLGGADKNGYRPVRIRVTFKKREDFYTGVTVNHNQWDEETRCEDSRPVRRKRETH